jgi:hypothetical protein
MSTEATKRFRSVDNQSRSIGLSIPQAGDSTAAIHSKLSALAEVIRKGQSISVATNYTAIANDERNPMKTAMAEMRPEEAFAWELFSEGKYPLPDFDWEHDREKEPVSPTPRRNAQCRAEALNRLYHTNKADPGHSVWMMKNKPFLLPLVKAMVRVIAAERDLPVGQNAGSTIQLADIESINKILSMSSQLLSNNRDDPASFEAKVAMRTLSSHRAKLSGLRRRPRRKQSTSSTPETHR